MESTRKTKQILIIQTHHFKSLKNKSSGHHSAAPVLSRIVILPTPARRSAGHRVAMLEMLKADLVGADWCLIVLLRAAES